MNRRVGQEAHGQADNGRHRQSNDLRALFGCIFLRAKLVLEPLRFRRIDRKNVPIERPTRAKLHARHQIDFRRLESL